MPTLDRIVTELEFLSDRLSTQVRTIAIGLLAVTWATLIGESTTLRSLAGQLRSKLLVVAALCVLALVFDFVQYLFGYVTVNRTRRQIEDAQQREGKYDYESLSWCLRNLFFWAKQAIILAAAVLFLVVLVPYIYSQ